MHLSQHELCTRKTELALEVKFYLDFHTSMATNTDQRKWRQIRISAVSRKPPVVHSACRYVPGREKSPDRAPAKRRKSSSSEQESDEESEASGPRASRRTADTREAQQRAQRANRRAARWVACFLALFYQSANPTNVKKMKNKQIWKKG